VLLITSEALELMVRLDPKTKVEPELRVKETPVPVTVRLAVLASLVELEPASTPAFELASKEQELEIVTF